MSIRVSFEPREWVVIKQNLYVDLLTLSEPEATDVCSETQKRKSDCS